MERQYIELRVVDSSRTFGASRPVSRILVATDLVDVVQEALKGCMLGLANGKELAVIESFEEVAQCLGQTIS